MKRRLLRWLAKQRVLSIQMQITGNERERQKLEAELPHLELQLARARASVLYAELGEAGPPIRNGAR